MQSRFEKSLGFERITHKNKRKRRLSFGSRKKKEEKCIYLFFMYIKI
ncbi:unnamed protein product [Paramecium octaurelia]|uniref:Uncharacterized protein n=1 Tax=Paramecium octaurelia TaxID=43137 RepID=A0A8S1X8F8_PAROT|nr:unnamed protein product [Paramecium octaurelia]